MGVTDDNQTWFQFEATRTDNLANKFWHLGDFFLHTYHKMNVGPFGYSKYTDKLGKEGYYYLRYSKNLSRKLRPASELNKKRKLDPAS